MDQSVLVSVADADGDGPPAGEAEVAAVAGVAEDGLELTRTLPAGGCAARSVTVAKTAPVPAMASTSRTPATMYDTWIFAGSRDCLATYRTAVRVLYAGPSPAWVSSRRASKLPRPRI